MTEKEPESGEMGGADPWARFKSLTAARIAMGRSGASQRTESLLDFSLAHAKARDAVHTPFEPETLEEALKDAGLRSLRVSSHAENRDEYLRRPDYGRRLSDASRQSLLENSPEEEVDLCFVVADGLSSSAVHAHGVPFLKAVLPWVENAGWTLAPIVLASQARVALGDEIGEFLNARLVVMLIGERPGLSSPDSLGVYVTFRPRVGRNDAERNCISNVRPAGLPYDVAAFKLAWLIDHALIRQLTGVNLKDDSDVLLDGNGQPPRMLPKSSG